MDLDLALEAAFLATWYVDYRQTTVTAKNPTLYYEKNPVLGVHPHPDRVKAYFAAGAIIHPTITYVLPKGGYRTAFQAVTLGIEIDTISANFRLGVRF